MNENKKAEIDTNAILMTLDQLSQTIDIMTSVVGRLRGHIEQNDTADSSKNTIPALPTSSHTLH